MQKRFPRYAVSIPVILHEGALRVPGLAQNISATGALVTDVDQRPPVGTVGRLRLHQLRASLRTQGPDSLELLAAVVRHAPGSFAVEFMGAEDRIEALLERAFGRGAVEKPEG